MPTQPAILGTARLGNFRLGYVPAALAAIRRTKLTILLAGVPARVRVSGLTVHDLLGAPPSTCSLLIDNANPPTAAQTLRLTVGVDTPRLLFSGTLQTTDLAYEAENKVNRVWPCTAIDYTARSNRRRPFGTWVQVSATTIAQYITAVFAPGFTSTHVAAGLPLVSIIFDGSTDFIGCLSELASAIGGYCKVEDLDVYLFQADTDDAPNPIDVTHPFLNDPPITCSQDVSQLRTRVYGKGHGEQVLSDVLAGETILPIADAVMFGTIGGGGRALAGTTPDGAQSQQIAYTGVRQASGGSLVGPGAAPSAAPTVAMATGAGLESGVHQYAVVFGTAVGKSLPGPLAVITVGVTAPPLTAPTPGTPTAGTGVDTGQHEYAVTFGTASGQTLPGPISAPVTVSPLTLAVSPPSAAPTLTEAVGVGFYGTGNRFRLAVAFVTAAGETTIGPFGSVMIGMANSGSVINVSAIPIGPPGTLSRNLYWTQDAGTNPTGQVYRNTVSGNVATTFTVPGNTGTNTSSSGQFGPTSNTAGTYTIDVNIVPLTGIPIGGSTVTSRSLYRRFNGASTFKLVVALGDNTTTIYTDSTPNASLGAAAPTTNTATANQVALTGIPIGAATVTYREIHRTIAGGSQLKLQQTIANNTATSGVTDATADASLGANAPTGDTSGLTQPTGQVNAGATSLLTASATLFPSSGWAILGSGQVVRYTGITGNTLTGIPSSGPGAILTTVLYGSQVLPAPALTGVPAKVRIAAPITGRPLTFLVRVKLRVAPGALANVLSLVNATTNVGFYLWVNSAGLVDAQEYTGASSMAETALGVTPGVWATIGGTFDGTTNYAYLDGVRSPGATAIPTPPSLLDTLFVGRLEGFLFGTTVLNGEMVDAAVYDIALSAAEMATIAAGALPSAVQAGHLVYYDPVPQSGGGLMRAMQKGAPVSIWVQRDDLAAQATQAAIDTANGVTPADGIYEGPPIVDERRGEASLIALCDANLQLFSRPIVTFTYATRDLKTRSGKTVHIDIPGYPVGDYVIQDVTITEIGTSPGTAPRFSVTASTVRFSLDDLLRRLLTAQAA